MHAVATMSGLEAILGPGGAMEGVHLLQQQGKVRFVGISMPHPDRSMGNGARAAQTQHERRKSPWTPVVQGLLYLPQNPPVKRQQPRVS